MSGAAQTARMVTRAPEVRSPLPIRVPSQSARAAQAASAVRVSQPAEPAEREAERVARRVVAMPAAAAAAPMARRMSALVPAAPTTVPAALGVGYSVGQPLPRRLRRDMEPRFGADFSAVRVHTGDSAARTSRRLNAAAFTVGRDMFFGRGRFQPDSAPGRGLIAHELTHTIQQGGAAQPATVQRSVDTTVHERSAPRVQRLGIQDALDYFAEKAEFVPGFSMLALLLGFNPISLRSVPRTAANLLRALFRLLPGGALITQALDNHGIVERVAAWAEGQLAALGDIGSAIRQSIDEFLDGLGWSDIFDLGGVWDRAKRIVTAPIDRIITFGTGLVSGIVTFIKDAILRPLAALIEPTRGYPLLKAVLGFDPVTGDPVPRNATTLIGGFMTLIGQDEVWQNIQRGNAIGQAWAWFQGAVTGYLGFVTQIPSQFLSAFLSLELMDIILVPRAFAKIIGVFASFYGRFLSWALGTVISLLEIILSVVAPGAMDYLRRAGAAFQSILRNPVGFCMNLVRAAKAGLQRFARNFLKHLAAGLLDWLTDSLPGIHIPQNFSLPEIFQFVMSVLGLTWANLRVKLVREVGEPAVKAMEAGFEIVVTLVRDGPAAAWEQIKESLTNLKQMAIDGIMDMVLDFVVIKAIPKLVSLFIPGPGFITAAIAIYDTVMTFMRQLSRLAHLVKGYIDAIVAIATGSIDTAAAAVEAQAARYMSLAITILAGMAGFGKVSKRVQDVLERIRKPIDKAMDRVVGWVVGMARRLGRFIAQAGLPTDPQERLRLGSQAALSVLNRFARRPVGRVVLTPLLAAVRTRYGLTAIELAPSGRVWSLLVKINPQLLLVSNAEMEEQPAGAHEAIVQQLLGLENQGGREVEIAPGKYYGAALAETLARISPLLLAADAESRNIAVDRLRGSDKIWTPLQGMIYAPHVIEQQRAVRTLSREMTASTVVYGLERGGARVAEQIATGTQARVVTIAKVRVPQVMDDGSVRQVTSKSRQVAALRDRIVAELASDPMQRTTVTITETMVGGGSTDALINLVNDLEASKKYPNVRWKILVLQQTIQTEDAAGVVELRHRAIARPNKVKLIVASTTYIVGEDVGFQTSRAHASARSPVILFKPMDERMYAYQIVPSGATTSADVIADLVAGKYNGKLRNVL